jgi:hypothetical protein
MSVVDLGNTFENSDGELKFPVVEAGTYNARVIGVEDKSSGPKSQHPGTPMWRVSFAIQDEGGEYHGFKLSKFYTIPAGEGSEWMRDDDKSRRIDELKRLWIATDAPSENGSLESEDLQHCTCRIVVGVSTFDGKPSNDVKDVLPEE